MMNMPEAPSHSPRAAALFGLLIPLGLVLLTVFIYGQTRHAQILYSWDDNRYLLENTLIRDFSPTGVKNLFLGDDYLGLRFYFAGYLPVTLFTYMLDYRLWGLDAAGYHLVNVGFQAVNVVLVYVVVRRFQGKRLVALLTALLFLAHPVQVESVAWISQRKSVVSMFFFLLALLAHMQSGTPKNRWALPLAWVLFLLATLSKPSAVAAPLLFMLYDYFWTRHQVWKIPLRALPYIAISLIAARLAVLAHEAVGGIKETPGGSVLGTFKLMAWVFWDYATMLVAPLDLNNYYLYPHDDINSGGYRIVLGVLILLGSVVVGVWSVYRAWHTPSQKPYLLFGVAWVWVFMLPVSNIVPIAVQRADRYLYFPSIMLFMLLSMGLVKLWENLPNSESRTTLIALVGCVVGLLLGISHQRVGVWNRSETLWRDHLEQYPTSETGILNYAVYFFNTQQHDLGAPLFERLIGYYPNHYKGHAFRGRIAFAQEDWEKAAAYLERAKQIDPTKTELDANLGIAYFQVGLAAFNANNYDRALAYYNLALPFLNNKDKAVAYNNIGFTNFTLGNVAESQTYYALALQLDPAYTRAMVNSGNSAVALADHASAVASFGAATAGGGLFDAESSSNYCLALIETGGDPESALGMCKRAIDLMPENGFYHTRLAYALLKLGRASEALPSAQKGTELAPTRVINLVTLGDVFAALGDAAAAEVAYRRALALNPQHEGARAGLVALGLQP